MTSERKHNYIRSTLIVVACVYLYVSMEWLFFVTKPSFFSAYRWLDRVVSLFVGVWPFLIAGVLLHSGVCCADWLLSRWDKAKAFRCCLLWMVPAGIIGWLSVMLVDNFTYTVFHFGIVKAGMYTIPLYWVLFLVVFGLTLRRRPPSGTGIPRLATYAVGTSLVLAAWSVWANPAVAALSGVRASGKTLPNIIVFSSDGVNAAHLSAYGYKRATTPNLDKWLGGALVAENAFTNSGMTSGSLTAMMTGRYPATTKMFYPPQTLRGNDAFQHLPGILRRLGYESLQETLPYYGDALSLNWLDSFDYANGRKLHWSQVKSTGVLQTSVQFSRTVDKRLRERAAHLLLIRPMHDAYAAVVSEAGTTGKTVSDDGRMDAVDAFIKRARRPFFIQVHLMGTHLNGPGCCLWHGTPVFQAPPGAPQAAQNSANFDNAILHADRYFGKMMDLLRDQGLLDNTIVVYTSDHATGWKFNSTVPLVFIFPGGKDAGRIAAPVQLIDIAPTLLDYMGVNIPKWMEGRSLLRDHLSFYRPIFVGYRAQYLGSASEHADIGPPLYDLAKDGLVVCNRWYVLTLASHEVTEGKVSDFRGTCDESKLPDAKTAGAMMTKHLNERGFKF